jgi:hypothetical protein
LVGQLEEGMVDVTVEWSVASMVECWVLCLDPNQAAGSVGQSVARTDSNEAAHWAIQLAAQMEFVTAARKVYRKGYWMVVYGAA